MMMMNSNEMLMKFGSIIGTIVFLKAMYEQYLPYTWREAIESFLYRYFKRIIRFFSPDELYIIFEEYGGRGFSRNKVYKMIEIYLSEKTSMKAQGLKANFVSDGKTLMLGLDDDEEVTDEYEGVQVCWSSCKHSSRNQTISLHPPTGMDEKRYYKVTFLGRHRELITGSYLKHVIEEGKAIKIRRRQRKLFTNTQESEYSSWSDIDFKHPASFNTLAMEPTKKEAIITDLVRFKNSKDYYEKIGKPWKRGYLLYGPPGTGKSTMIVAMANLLEYDIYDLELTAVEDNTQLRSLLIETTSKSLIVIEDIDCSLDLTGQRSSPKKEKEDDDDDKEEEEEKKKDKKSKVTLSGVLNFIDGIWSACGEERIIIFTTNFVEKLDPALIRRGRMDMHIELSYCCYEAFKLLARNYLDLESHNLFETIRKLLEETKMTPADVAENLMPKSLELNVEECLENLIEALEKARNDAMLKAAEEERDKEEEEKANKLEAQEEEKKVVKVKVKKKKRRGK